MNATWKNLMIKTLIWLTAEVLLNVLGLDNLADYSEFLFERHIPNLQSPVVTVIFPGVLNV
jgi:hypothetical protein